MDGTRVEVMILRFAGVGSVQAQNVSVYVFPCLILQHLQLCCIRIIRIVGIAINSAAELTAGESFAIELCSSFLESRFRKLISA